MTRWLALLLLLVWRIAAADEATLLAGLETDDPKALAAAIAAIEHAPTTPELADVLFAAGRACEDRLHDPARALAIYERIVRELPDAGISIAANRRIAQLQGVREHAKEAAELAGLVANADHLPHAEVVRRGDALVAAPWPGAVDAALWLADWQCRTTQFADAQARYQQLRARWPNTEQGRLAVRNAAGCAIEAHDWSLAEQLARQLPGLDEVERAVRDDLIDAAARGRRRDQLYVASWIGLVLAILVLLASLAEALLRGGWRRPTLRPPIEVIFLAPVAAVIVAASFTAHRAIAPAVLRISLVGLALAWVSGIALDLLRARDRAVHARAILHVVACAVGVLAVGYIAMTRDGLLDMLAETVRFGPGA
ncbi:MAG TPA: tetratricopeptide repeat protein [Kofleriaceae bacterium]